MSDDIKPKCVCGEVGDDCFYYFQKDERGKGGKWWHYKCYLEISKIIEKNLASSIPTRDAKPHSPNG